ncbi:MAG: NAD(P)/FAD-dependent oxidoreductase [Bacteroidetes bacterium]|nr:NAD(P)/FAD-dependent oxidoreductase [Bacteroidota bacterium]
MNHLVVLGAGTGGTVVVNRLLRHIDTMSWNVTIIDESDKHFYQPGFLFIPFGMYEPKDIVKSKRQFLPREVRFIQHGIEEIKPTVNQVLLKDGSVLHYDVLVIATGVKIAPEMVPGLVDSGWYEEAFDFYTFEGALQLSQALRNWKGGQLVVHIAEMPIKCPIAPLEFSFLADWYFTKRGKRDDVEIILVTPLPGVFTKARANAALQKLLDEKRIRVVTDFYTERVDGTERKLYDYSGNSVSYDILVTVPPNTGDTLIARSGLGDEMNYVPTDKHTLQSKNYENIFVIGDATDLPISKAGSVAHFQAELLAENIARYINKKPLEPSYDGHANCFIESGHGKAVLIDFNYEIEPSEGHFPLPYIGPLSLLRETRLNHYAKLASRHLYWNVILRGLPIPFVTARMNPRGRKI